MTVDDAAWLVWLDRVRYAPAHTLAFRLGLPVGSVRPRLTILKKRGLARPRQPCRQRWDGKVVRNGPVVWQPTARGRLLSGSDQLVGPAAPFAPFRTAHTLAVADEVARQERDGRYLVLTEAELRRCGNRWTVKTEGLDAETHRPDAVLDPIGTAGGATALEVELSRRGPHEWWSILAGYEQSPQYAGRSVWLAAHDVVRPLTEVIVAGQFSGAVVMAWAAPRGGR